MPVKHKKTIIPRGKYVLIKPTSKESTETDNGIIIPSMVEQEQKSQGEVADVGSEVKDIKTGDIVVYGAYAGESIKVKEGKETVDYKLIFDEDIIAFIR